MKIPLAAEGAREIGIALAVSAGWACLWIVVGFWPIALVAALPLLAVLMFFRDPARTVPTEPQLLLSAADGTVTHVQKIEKEPIIGGPAVRISVFLSIASVHINRAPCAGRVIDTKIREGLYLDARDPSSADKNACNTLTLAPDRPLRGPIIIKQLTGRIARRIVCHVGAGDRLAAGEKFGMIKFGSRTDVIVPEQPGLEVAVKVGEKVRAGTTVLMRLTGPQVAVGGGGNGAVLQAVPR